MATLASNPGYNIINPSAATITIVDADIPAITLCVPQPTASKAGTSTGAFAFTRTGSTSTNLTVFFDIFGTAINGADYAAITSSLVIPAGTNRGWLLYSPGPGFTGADSFTYTISDRYATATGLVTVSIRVDNNPSPNLTNADLGNGSHVIWGDGFPGLTYRIQFAESAPRANWQTLGTVTADALGAFQFINRTGSPQRLYRTVFP